MAKYNEKEMVQLTNEMLRQLHVNHEVRHWRDIDATVFLTLFEGINGEPLPDIIAEPKNSEEEAHNVQCAIDTISREILNTSLSHVTGEDIVNQDSTAIANLLEIFSGLLDFILDRISSETSSEKDVNEVEDDERDPDRLQGDVIQGILEQELSRGYSDFTWTKDEHTDLVSSRSSIREKQQEKHSKSKSKSSKEAKRGSDGRARSSDEESVRSGSSNGKKKHASRHRNGELNKDILETTDEYIALGQQSNLTGSLSRTNNTDELIALGKSLSPYKEPYVKDLARSAPEGARAADYMDLSKGGVRLASTAPVTPGFALHSSANTHMASTIGGSGLVVPASIPGVPEELQGLGMRPSSLTQPRSTAPGKEDPATFTHYLHHYHHYDKTMGPADIPPANPVTSTGVSRTAPGSLPSTAEEQTKLHLPGASDKSRSYEDLEKVVEDTVSLSRDAVSTSMRRSAVLPSSHGDLRSSVTASYSAQVLPSAAVSNPTELLAQSNGECSIKQGNADPGRNRVRHTVKRPQLYNTYPALHSSPPKRDNDPYSLPQPPSYKTVSNPQPNLLETRDQHIYINREKVMDANADTMKLSDLVQGLNDKNDAYTRKARRVGFVSDDQSSESGKEQNPPRDNAKQSNLGRADTATSPIKSLSGSKKPVSTKHTSSRDAGSRVADQLAPCRQMDSDLKDARELHRFDHLDHPKTFREYLDKYYGTVDRRDQMAQEISDDDEVLSQHSDSAVDYTPDPIGSRIQSSSESESSEESEATSRPSQSKTAKSVRFQDLLDRKATGNFADIRNSLRRDDNRARAKTGLLDRLYAFELKHFQDDVKDSLREMSKEAKEKEVEYRRKVLSKPRTSKYKPERKYGSPGVLLRPRYRARPRFTTTRARKRSASASPSVGRTPTVSSEGDFLPLLLEEFPFLHLSTETLHELWRKSTRQLEQLSKAELDVRHRKSKAQIQIEEAERRQQILMDIMKKELAHNQRMKEIKERQQQQQQVRSKVRDSRTQSARGRRYYEDYQIRNRSRMAKKKTKEELIFKKLFQDCLDLQKERIREMRHYARDQRTHRTKQQQAELESLENYYRDQFEMLAEALATERSHMRVRESAQTKVLQEMKKSLRKKMEQEVKNFQEQMYRDEDDEYFRQLDADRLRHQVSMANYMARV